MAPHKHVLILFVFAGLLCVSMPVHAERATDFDAQIGRQVGPPPPERPEDAKSTTGPVPPPEAMRAQVSPGAMDVQVVLNDVPAYMWYDGCGPTSAAMVIGYWDGKGFDGLVSGSAVTQTATIDAMISSPESFSDYALPLDSSLINSHPLLDRSEPPSGDEHADNSIADFMKTSQSHYGLYYGWSYFSEMPVALTSWVHWASPQYEGIASNNTLPEFWGGTLTWEMFKAEIDAGRPVVLLVDVNGDRETDHFVAAVGYGEVGSTKLYAALNTWDTNVHWYPFVPMQPGTPWGIYGATFFRIQVLTPGGFGKTSPGNTAWGQGPNVTLSWENSSNANSYEYCYDTIDNGECDGTWTSTTSTSANVNGLTTGLIYYWQVRANNSAGSTYANGGTWWLWTTGSIPPLFVPMVGK